jgi:hypothetical protein
MASSAPAASYREATVSLIVRNVDARFPMRGARRFRVYGFA